MKSNLYRLLALVACLVLVIFVFTPHLHAQDSVPVPAAAPAPRSMSDIVMGATTLLSALFALWKHSQASAKAKVVVSLVKTIEWATALPEVQKAEGDLAAKIKNAATQEATALGVQDDLHQIVLNVTPQVVTAASAAAAPVTTAS